MSKVSNPSSDPNAPHWLFAKLRRLRHRLKSNTPRAHRARQDFLRLSGQSLSSALESCQELLIKEVGPVASVGSPHAQHVPCEVLRKPDGFGTFVVFSGMGAPARSEFFKTVDGLGGSAVFIKDFRQAWYQSGLIGISEDRAGTIDFLRAQLSDFPRPWTFLGLSAGGHAAISFGDALKADNVVAFGPQTFLNEALVALLRPSTLPELTIDLKDPDLDLVQSVAQGNGVRCGIYLHYAAGNAIDSKHAMRLEALPNVHLRAHTKTDHNIAGDLRASGQLSEILSDIHRKCAP